MPNHVLTFRQESPLDYRAVETLTRDAFFNLFSPGCNEHYLVHQLRKTSALIAQLDYVAETKNHIVASIFYAKASIVLDTGEALPVITFGPVSVLPDWQQQGIGSALIRHTLALAGTLRYTAVLIYGDPAFYSRLGFVPAESFGIAGEDNEYRDSLQAYELIPGILHGAQGRFIQGDAYQIDDAAADAFDQSFPFKQKRTGTATQKRFLEIIAKHKPRA